MAQTTWFCLLLAHHTGQQCDGWYCRLWLSSSHIVKTMQDRPQLVHNTTKNIKESASLILLPHSDPPRNAPWKDIPASNTKYMQILIRPPDELGIRPQLLSTTVSTVGCVVNCYKQSAWRLDTFVYKHQTSCWWCPSRRRQASCTALWNSCYTTQPSLAAACWQ